jgi:hypothetical protein
MMKRKANEFLGFLKPVAAITLSLLVMTVATSSLTSPKAYARLPAPDPISTAEQFDAKCKKNFFGLVPWYKYIDQEFTNTITAPAASLYDGCAIKCFNLFTKTVPNECGRKSSDIPAVLLAVIDDLLRVAGMLAIAFVIVGAFKYVTSEGKPDDTAQAQSTIVNALMGLAMALIAIAFVSYIGNRLGG